MSLNALERDLVRADREILVDGSSASPVETDSHRCLGFFPQLESPTGEDVSQGAAIEELTRKMAKLSSIDSKSRVLDIACGSGKVALDLAMLTGSKIWGVERSRLLVSRASELLQTINAELVHAEQAPLHITFISNPLSVAHESFPKTKFSHVWSQVPLCVMDQPLSLAQLAARAFQLLAPLGRLVIADVVGPNCPASLAVSKDTKEKLWLQRDSDPQLNSHSRWREIVEGAGFKIEHYSVMDHHLELSYRHLAETQQVLERNRPSAKPLSRLYENAANEVAMGQIGMNLCIARKAAAPTSA